MAYTPPLPGYNTASGFNGFSFTDPEYSSWGQGATGTPNAIKNSGMFPTMARYLLKGSEDASQSALKGFESGFRARAQGIASGFSESQNRLGGEVASQGYSPDLVRRMLSGGQASSQAAIGGASAEAKQGFAMHLAELQKNTGLELANLTKDQMNLIMQGYIAKQSKAKKGLGGTIGGLVGGTAGALLGGPQGAAAGYSIGSGTGSAFD